MRFKVGDLVVVKRWEDIAKLPGHRLFGTSIYSSKGEQYFTDDMRSKCCKAFVVDGVDYRDQYVIGGYSYLDEWLMEPTSLHKAMYKIKD